MGSMHVIAACGRAATVKRFVLISSTTVYGSSGVDPAMFTEDMAARRQPSGGIPLDHLSVEGYVRGMSRKRPDIDVTILRIPAILGLSSWDSPYSLWCKATGRIESETMPTSVTERGDLLEPKLLEWLGMKLPESRVRPGRTFAMDATPPGRPPRTASCTRVAAAPPTPWSSARPQPAATSGAAPASRTRPRRSRRRTWPRWRGRCS